MKKNYKNKLRLLVVRTNQYVYSQIIDDKLSKTVVSQSSLKLKNHYKKVSKVNIAVLVGKNMVKKASNLDIKSVILDCKRYSDCIRYFMYSYRIHGFYIYYLKKYDK